MGGDGGDGGGAGGLGGAAAEANTTAEPTAAEQGRDGVRDPGRAGSKWFYRAGRQRKASERMQCFVLFLEQDVSLLQEQDMSQDSTPGSYHTAYILL